LFAYLIKLHKMEICDLVVVKTHVFFILVFVSGNLRSKNTVFRDVFIAVTTDVFRDSITCRLEVSENISSPSSRFLWVIEFHGTKSQKKCILLVAT
jgi:hypothetical protein